MATSGRLLDQKAKKTTVIRKIFVARVRLQGWFMHGGVGLQCSSYVCASSVWLSGFKEREGGALAPQNHISDQGWKQSPFHQRHI